MITARLHNNGSETILAACDSDLMGKILEDEDIRIELDNVFFGGSNVTEDEFRGMLAQATSANLVGEATVRVAIEAECVHPDSIRHIAKVPFAMFFCMG